MTVQPGPNDKWTLDSYEYSRDKFYTKTTDGRGNSELVQVKVTPYVNGMLQMLVESPDFPDYRTRADIVRDALAHLFHERQMMQGDPIRMAALKEATDMMISQAEAERMVVTMENQKSYVMTLVNGLKMARHTDNLTMLEEAIERAEAGLHHLPFALEAELSHHISESKVDFRRLVMKAAIEQQVHDKMAEQDWE